jgi:chromosome partitioning protein
LKGSRPWQGLPSDLATRLNWARWDPLAGADIGAVLFGVQENAAAGRNFLAKSVFRKYALRISEMSVIAITGRKGGIGKTTLCGNLAAELVSLGRLVAVLDADPQQSLMAWARLGEGVLSRSVTAVDTTKPDRFRLTVEAAARAVDRVLIDTPPGFADPALLASLVADVVLLPAGPSPLDIMAARDALTLAREARAQRGNSKPIMRFVPSKVQMYTNLGRELGDSLENLGEKVLPAVCLRVAVAEAALQGLTVGEYAPGSLAHEEFAALAKAVERLAR